MNNARRKLLQNFCVAAATIECSAHEIAAPLTVDNDGQNKKLPSRTAELTRLDKNANSNENLAAQLAEHNRKFIISHPFGREPYWELFKWLEITFTHNFIARIKQLDKLIDQHSLCKIETLISFDNIHVALNTGWRLDETLLPTLTYCKELINVEFSICPFDRKLILDMKDRYELELKEYGRNKTIAFFILTGTIEEFIEEHESNNLTEPWTPYDDVDYGGAMNWFEAPKQEVNSWLSSDLPDILKSIQQDLSQRGKRPLSRQNNFFRT
jgi:hypothetical protein